MILDILRALRPSQWIKNLVVLAGLIFSRSLLSPERLLYAVAGFWIFCLISSGVYVLNDLVDRDRDRHHPTKCKRPIASGRLSPGFALLLGVGLLFAGNLSAWGLGSSFGWVVVAFTLLNLLYTAAVKNVVLVDVLFIAIGFVIRAIGGVEALHRVEPELLLSPWLLVCTLFLSLLLGLCKRRQEMAHLNGGASQHRPVLGQYSLGFLDQLIAVVTGATILSYALYTIWPATVEKFHTVHLIYTVPFVVYGVFRYLFLVYAKDRGENPSDLLVRDLPLDLAILLWFSAVVLILYRSA